MKTHLALALSLFAATAVMEAHGEAVTLRTLSGKTYQGVTIAKVDPDGICFRHSNGAGKILFADMPSNQRQEFGYDAKKAVAYEEALEARREKVLLARIERDREIAKAQTAAFESAALQTRRAIAMNYGAAGGISVGGGFISTPWGFGGVGIGTNGYWSGDVGYSGVLGGPEFYQRGYRTGTATYGVVGRCAPVHEYGSSVARVGLSPYGYGGYRTGTAAYGVVGRCAPVHEYGSSVARVGLSTYGYGGLRTGGYVPVHEYGRGTRLGIAGFSGYNASANGSFRQPYSPAMQGGRFTNGVPSLGAGFSPSPAIRAPGGGGAMFSAGR